MRNTLKVLAALLTYPDEAAIAAVPEMRAALDAEGALPARHRVRLHRLLDEFTSRDLMDLQERYVLLFDRTRSLSLHLFEHVHGESRDRGQAMVDLARLYERHGLVIDARELPDYIPLFLEFLSEIPPQEALGHLQAAVHIFEAIRQRLKKRKSVYTSVFSALQALARTQPHAAAVAQLLEEPDEDPDDLEALDRVWMEEPVTFGPTADPSAAGCGKVAGMLRRIEAGMPDAVQGHNRGGQS